MADPAPPPVLAATAPRVAFDAPMTAVDRPIATGEDVPRVAGVPRPNGAAPAHRRSAIVVGRRSRATAGARPSGVLAALLPSGGVAPVHPGRAVGAAHQGSVATVENGVIVTVPAQSSGPAGQWGHAPGGAWPVVGAVS
jgi:hypothetical protein